MRDSDMGSIGVFDSGLGGLSVLRVLREVLPYESFIYLGDGKRCPYGERSREEILRFTEEAVERLLAEGCKMVVLACNTATAVAIKQLRERYPDIPFVGLEPAVKPAALTSQSGVVGVVATRRSLEGEHFRTTAAKYADRVRIVTSVGEGFVEAVERDEEALPATEELVRRAIEPLLREGADRIVLGCTHYPFLRKTIERVVGDGVEIMDSSEAVARRVAALLDEYNLREEEGSPQSCLYFSFADEAYVERLKMKDSRYGKR